MNGAWLIGDAASLVDPFSGEGVGNALVTGEIAARHIVEGRSPEEYQNEVWAPLVLNSRTVTECNRSVENLVAQLVCW